MSLSEKLVELRTAAGMTQERLAEVASVPLWTLRAYEQGRTRRIPFDVVVRLAEALGTDCTAFTAPPKKGRAKKK